MKAAPEHGTRSMYVYGCRCEPCAKANRDYQRRYMFQRYVPSSRPGAKDCGQLRNDGSVTPRWEKS